MLGVLGCKILPQRIRIHVRSQSKTLHRRKSDPVNAYAAFVCSLAPTLCQKITICIARRRDPYYF
jgi:hypothetical protein